MADNATANSQGTTLQSPLSPEIKNTSSWDKGEPSKVPSNDVTMKHSKIVQGIKEQRGTSKAT
eukprot:14864895-Ditylum_brightwellii.AAC.1